MWPVMLVLTLRRVRCPGRPRSPRMYAGRHSVVITAKYATRFRVACVQALITFGQRIALLTMIVFGVCLLPVSSWEDLNRCQLLRLDIDRVIIESLPIIVTKPFVSGTVLKDWTYVIFCVVVLVVAKGLKSINRHVIAGKLLGKRLVLKLKKDSVTLYLLGILPWTYRQSGDVRISFRAVEDPRECGRGKPPIDQSVSCEMLVGVRRVMIATILGMPKAEDFVLVCGAALKLANELSAERSRQSVATHTARVLE